MQQIKEGNMKIVSIDLESQLTDFSKQHFTGVVIHIANVCL